MTDPHPTAEPTPDTPPETGDLTTGQLRSLAARGVVLLGSREILIRIMGFAGNVVFARLLTPADFGAIALGSTILVFGSFLGDAGVGAALIRLPKPPERILLQSVLGFQLLITLLVAAVVAGTAVPFGRTGGVAAVMILSLPPVAFRTPGVILFERELAYRPIVAVEIAENLSYLAWGVTTVAVGWGIWGLATATVVRAVVGSALMVRLSPVGLLRPRFSWRRIRHLMGFGVQVQAAMIVNIVRDQGINVATAAIASIPTLGIWSLASRILQVPFLVFNALWRVSFPAMSRLISAGENPRPILERGVGLVAVASGVLFVPLAGAAPTLVPVIFGHRWADVPDVLPWACLGLMIGGPVSSATVGYLYAVGDARTVLRSLVIGMFAWWAVGLPLLPVVGVAALGLGWMAGTLAEAAVLLRGTTRRSGARFFGALVPPLLAASGAGGLAWWFATSNRHTLLLGLVAALIGEGAFLVSMVVFRRGALGDAFGVVRRSFGPTPSEQAGL
jgi:O-antigen/teichoic acid export membrane protein